MGQGMPVELAIVISTISLVKDGVAAFNRTKNLQPHDIAGLHSGFVKRKTSLQPLRHPRTCYMKLATD